MSMMRVLFFEIAWHYRKKVSGHLQILFRMLNIPAQVMANSVIAGMGIVAKMIGSRPFRCEHRG